MLNLTEFELGLYEEAKKAGFESSEPDNEVAVREAIEGYLIGVWRRVFSSEFKAIKGKLDPHLYNLGDAQVDELVVLLRQSDFSELEKRFAENPELINRRDTNLRTLLHHAIIWEKAEAAVQFLLQRNASLKIATASGLNAIDLMVQTHHEYYLDVFFQSINKTFSVYEILFSMLSYNAKEKACVAMYENTAAHITPENKARLLDFSLAKKYCLLVEALVYDHAPLNTSNADGEMPLCVFSKSEKKPLDKKTGMASFLLAAGAEPIRADVARQIAEDKFADPGAGWYGYFIEGARAYSELILSSEGQHPSVIILTEGRYNRMRDANLLTTNDHIVYIVFQMLNLTSTYTINYMKEGLPQRLPIGDNPCIDRLVTLIYYRSIVVLSDDMSEELGYWGKNYYNKKEMLDSVDAHVLEAREFVARRVNAEPLDLNRSGLLENEELAIQWFKNTFHDGPIPLYDHRVQFFILGRDQKEKLWKLQRFVLERTRVLEDRKNLKYLLYYSTGFLQKNYEAFIVEQRVPPGVPLYQLILDAGVPLSKKQCYARYTLELYAARCIELVRKNQKPLDNKAVSVDSVNEKTLIDELDLLKAIKSTYLYTLERAKGLDGNQSVCVAIRDSIVLDWSTLFLSVIRSNRDLTELKDTETYIKICKLVENESISNEAKDELRKRVLQGASLRDVVLYLALVCDFENDKAQFIELCFDHLLLENPSGEQRAALNAALRLLNVGEHERLRDHLIKASHDEALLPTLQARLPEKNCAFIDIIRTSAKHRDLKNTGKFQLWAEKLKPVEVKPVAAPKPKPYQSTGIKRGLVQLALKVGFLAPVAGAAHTANINDDKNAPEPRGHGLDFF